MRFSLLFAFCLSVLAAFGLQGVTAWWSSRISRLAALPSARAAARGKQAGLSRQVPSLVAALAILAVTLELLAFGRGYNPALAPAELAPATAVTDYLRAELPPGGRPATWRALGLDNTILLPSANLYYDIPMVSGYDSMETRTTTELVALMSSDPGGAYFIKEIAHFDQAWQIGALLGVRYVLSPIELPPPLELVLDGPTKIYANPAALPRAFAATSVRLIEDKEQRLAHLADPAFDPREAVLERAPRGLELAPGQSLELASADVTLDAYDDLDIRITVDVAPAAATQALIILTDAWDAGWQAELDGQRVHIERVDHALRGVFVPAGTHQLTFRYRPPAITVGLALGAIGLLGILAMLFLPDREKTAGPKPPALF